MDVVCRTAAFMSDMRILRFCRENGMALDEETYARATDKVVMEWLRENDSPYDALIVLPMHFLNPF